MPDPASLFRTGLAIGTLALSFPGNPCPEDSTACVRDIPGQEEPWQEQQVLVEWQSQGQEAGELIVDSDGSVHIPATVRELPPEFSWGWESIDIQDNHALAGPGGYPAEISERMICPRSPGQALAWMSSAGDGDESLINRALSAYDWRNGRNSQVGEIVDLIEQWPQGHWEQQYYYPEYETPRPVGRYRYVSISGEVYTWVRTVRVLGCWSVLISPPKAPQEQPWHGSQGSQTQQLPENTQQSGNLYILWESEPPSDAMDPD